MQEKLPENIDLIEDFYRSAFSNETEMPSADLWSRTESQIGLTQNSSGPPALFKNFLLLTGELLLISSVLLYITVAADKPAEPALIPEPKKSIELPITRETKLSPAASAPETPPAKKRSIEPGKHSENQVVHQPAEITEPSFRQEEDIPYEEPELLPAPLPKPEEVQTEPEDLYTKLKNKADTSKSLFIEKKK